jgi:hypothetical protein
VFEAGCGNGTNLGSRCDLMGCRWTTLHLVCDRSHQCTTGGVHLFSGWMSASGVVSHKQTVVSTTTANPEEKHGAPPITVFTGPSVPWGLSHK